jgi:hypothetical protein
VRESECARKCKTEEHTYAYLDYEVPSVGVLLDHRVGGLGGLHALLDGAWEAKRVVGSGYWCVVKSGV